MGNKTSKESTAEASVNVDVPSLEAVTDITCTDKEIDAGAFAVVYEGYRNSDRTEDGVIEQALAIKVFKKGTKVNFKTDVETKQMEEARLAFRVSAEGHPNIVKVFGIWDGHMTKQLAIVMERCAMSMFAWLSERRSGDIPTENKRSVLMDVCRGMMHLKKFKVFHGDLTTKNILLNSPEGRLVAKITDFGLSRVVDGSKERHSLNHGTEDFMPPEMLRSESKNHSTKTLEAVLRQHGDEQVDLFSFGCCALHLGCGEWPCPEPLLYRSRLEDRPEMLSEFDRRRQYVDKIESFENGLFRSLIFKCLSNTPSHRGTFTMVYGMLEQHLKQYPENSYKQLYHDKTMECEDLNTNFEREVESKKQLEREMEKKEVEAVKMKECHEEEVVHLRKELSDMKSTHDTLSEQLKVEQHNHSDTQSIVEEKQTQLKELEGRLAREKEESQRLQKQVDGMFSSVTTVQELVKDRDMLKEKKGSVEEELKRKSTELKTVSGLHSEFEKKFEDASTALKKTEDELAEARKNLQSSKAEYQRSQQKCKEWERKYTEFKGKYDTSSDQLTQLRSDFRDLKGAKAQLSIHKKNLEDEKKRLEVDISNYQKSSKELTVELKKATDAKKTKEQNVTELQETIWHLKKEKGSLEKDKGYLESELAKSTRAEKEWKEKAKTLEREKNATSKELSEVRETLARVRAEKRGVEEKLKEEKASCLQLKGDFEQLELKLQAVTKRNTVLETKEAQQDDTIAALNKTVEEKNEAIFDYHKRNSTLEAKKNKLKEELNTLRTRYNTLEKDASASKTELEKTKNTLAVREDDLQSCQKKCTEIERARALQERTLENHAEVISENQNLAARNQELEAAKKDLENVLDSVEKDRDHYKKNYEETSEDLRGANEAIGDRELKLKNKDEVIQLLERQVQSMKLSLEKSSNDYDELQNRMQSSKREYTRHLAEMEEKLVVASKERQNELESSFKVASEVKENRDSLKKDYDEIYKKYHKTLQECRQAKTSLKATSQEFEEEKKKLQIAEQRSEELDREHSSVQSELRERIRELEAEVQRQKKLIETYRKDHGHVEDREMELQKKLRKSEDLVQERERQISHLETELDSTINKLKDTTEAKEELSHKLATIKMECAQMRIENSTLHVTVTKRDDHVRELSEEVTKYKLKEDNCIATTERLNDREQELEDLKKILALVEEDKKGLSNQSTNQEVQIAKLEKELHLLQTVLEETRSDKENLSSQCKDLSRRSDEYLDQLKKARTGESRVSSEVANYREKYGRSEVLLKQYEEEVRKFKLERDDFKSKMKACSSSIIDMEPYLYCIAQLETVFNPISAAEFDEACLKKGRQFPSCEANLLPFDEHWEDRVSPLIVKKNLTARKFLGNLVIPRRQNLHPVQGLFCIVNFHEGHPQLHVFVVNSCHIILVDTTSTHSASAVRFIQVTIPLESQWWNKRKLPRDHDGILFKPVGVYQTQPDHSHPLPPILEPIVNWISGQILQSLKSRVEQSFPLLLEDKIAIAIHPPCSIHDS